MDPEGPPRLLQAFVKDGAGNFTLTWGVHPDLNTCGFDRDQCDEGFSCAESGEQKDHCVDGSGNAPIVENAIVYPAQMRLISKELLNPQSVEQFLCACGSGCSEAQRYSVTPDCASCGDDPDTSANESGRCVDNDDDTLPDFTTLVPNVATITCGSLLNYSTGVSDGFYYPSGNQFPTAIFGFDGLGPAIVLVLNGTPLPTNSDCTVAMTSQAKDKDNNSFEAGSSPITFHTQNLAIAAGRKPSSGATGVSVDLAAIEIPFNTELDGASVTATTVTVKEAEAADPLALAPALDSSDPTLIVIELAEGTLKAGTEYEVTVTTGVKDSFGQAIPAAVTYSFTTAAAM